MEPNVLIVNFSTPPGVSSCGSLPVLDSVLLQRLCLFTYGDVDRARDLMPLKRHSSGIWMCGGGYWAARRDYLSTRPYPIFRTILKDEGFRDLCGSRPRQTASLLTKVFGQETDSTSYMYQIARETTIRFRFVGDAERVHRLIEMEMYLGVGHSVGLGQIKSIAIEPAQDVEDELRWVCVDARGRLTRPLPESLAHSLNIKGVSEFGLVEAPYSQSEFSRPIKRVRPYPVGA